jgi:hypothetical protein
MVCCSCIGSPQYRESKLNQEDTRSPYFENNNYVRQFLIQGIPLRFRLSLTKLARCISVMGAVLL